MTEPGCLRHQRHADHVHRVATPKQAVSAEQHMTDPASHTPRTTRTPSQITATTTKHPPSS